MMTTVYENTKKQYKSTENFLEQKVQMLKPSEDDSIETPKDGQSEQKVALTTSKSVMDSSKVVVKVIFMVPYHIFVSGINWHDCW